MSYFLNYLPDSAWVIWNVRSVSAVFAEVRNMLMWAINEAAVPLVITLGAGVLIDAIHELFGRNGMIW